MEVSEEGRFVNEAVRRVGVDIFEVGVDVGFEEDFVSW
jgi:hypothetical protein